MLLTDEQTEPTTTSYTHQSQIQVLNQGQFKRILNKLFFFKYKDDWSFVIISKQLQKKDPILLSLEGLKGERALTHRLVFLQRSEIRRSGIRRHLHLWALGSSIEFNEIQFSHVT